MKTTFRTVVVRFLFFLTLAMWFFWMLSWMFILPLDVLGPWIDSSRPGLFQDMNPTLRMILDTAFGWLLLTGLPIYALFVRLIRRWYGKVKYVENSGATYVVAWLRLIPKT
jgi:hypothetical protein